MVGKKLDISDLGQRINFDDIVADNNKDYKMLKQNAVQNAEGLPSSHNANLRAKLRDKTQMNFNLPRFVKDEFERIMLEEGYGPRGHKKFLLALLREKGADIPPDHQMDLRTS